MSRYPRVVIPGVPMHIRQRGVNRCETFLFDEDFAFYLWALREAAIEAGCAIHAYVLMTNHVHLLTTPSDTTGPARMMLSLGRRYVRYFNDRHRRTGTLWEGRYRSALVETTDYLFSCSRYIELNPVAAKMIATPAEYAWSSYRANAMGGEDALVTPHALYAALGADRDARCAAYRSLFATELRVEVVAAIRAALRGRAQLYTTRYDELVAMLRADAAPERGRDAVGEDGGSALSNARSRDRARA